MRALPLLLLSSAIALGLGLSWPRGAAEAQSPSPSQPTEPAPAVVELADAVQTEFAPLQWTPGSVLSRQDARLAAEEGGRLLFVAEVGHAVRRGEVVAELDADALRLQAGRAEADLARLDLRIGLAERQLARLRQLSGGAAVSLAQLDLAEAELGMSRREREAAALELDRLRLRIARHRVVAPFDGVVVERYAERGEVPGAAGPLLRLVDTDAVELRVRAPVALAAHLVPGQTVALAETDTPGTIAAVVPVGDEASRLLELRIALPAPLPVGSALQVGLPAATPRAVVAVPQDALIARREGSYVIRVGETAQAERVAVETGERFGDLVEVRQGIAAGDRLVVRGGERLQPGQRVRLATDATAALN